MVSFDFNVLALRVILKPDNTAPSTDKSLQTPWIEFCVYDNSILSERIRKSA